MAHRRHGKATRRVRDGNGTRAGRGGRSRLAIWLTRLSAGILVTAVVFGVGFGVGMRYGAENRTVASAGADAGRAAPSRPVAPARPSLTHAVPTTAAAPRLMPDLDPRPAVPAGARDRPAAPALEAAAPPAEPRRWLANAVPVPHRPGLPMVAIVLDDMGLDRPRSARAIALPAPLTVAYLAYAQDLVAQTREARARGHELLVHVPMQPAGDADPGPGALRVGEPATALAARLTRIIGLVDGHIGINNHMGSRFTADPDGMRTVLQVLRRHDLLFLDSLTSSRSLGLRLGRETGAPVVARDVFLDDVDSQEEVIYRLEQTERIARATGTAIAIGHPRDATLAVLERWLPEARARGLAIVPLSAVAKARLGLAPVKAASTAHE